MLNKDFFYGQILAFLFSIQNVHTDNIGFVCPKDGRWPHPADCEKFYTCNGGVGAEAWCGNGMAYDAEHSRCDLLKNIDCKNGERSNWTPSLERSTESISEKPIVKNTNSNDNQEDKDEKNSQTTMKSTTIITNKLILSKKLSSSIVFAENSRCTFQGNMPDQENCQSYFTCKDDIIVRFQCPDKHLFDEDLHTCNDYRKVFCGNRPTNEYGNDPCVGQSNGWYADYGNQCRSYFLCADQRKTKFNECPLGSKWNAHRLRCDDPKYIGAPCGYRNNHANNFLSLHSSPSYYYLITIMTFSSFRLLAF